MKQYTIITNLYEVTGGSFKYAINPKKTQIVISYNRSEREDFLKKWEYILKEEMMFDLPKVYFTDFDQLTLIDITDRLLEIKNTI
mgnify:CR=1 FL=1